MKKPIILGVGIALWAVLIVFICIKVQTKNPDLSEKLSSGAEQKEVSEEASFQAQEGAYTLTVKSVYDTLPDTDEKNPPKAKRVAVIVYQYTNADIKEGLVISDAHFKAYDKDGTELEKYPQKGLFVPGEANAEGTITASVAFALNSDVNYIEFDYYNDLSSVVPDAVYTEEW